MANDRLEQLLDAWMSDRDRGVMRTATELCTDSPELSDELSRRIQIMMKFEQLADVDQQDTRISQANIDTSHSTDVPESSPLRMQPLPAAIGGFRPLELLGEGGMGAVYLAEDHQLGRRVAVKVMKKELAADPDAKHRFLREARAMAAIEHDNIMTIYTVGEDQGTPFLVMPVLKGETLEDRLRRENRLSNAEIVRIGREIAAGLAAAHSHGLVHRDIKPSNIWLEGSQGRVRILDFGLARPASEDQKVTHSGTILGTPAYMAPEQAAGTEATPRSDLFSLGAVLYRMATGQQPFAGPNMMATLSNLANRIPESPQRLNPDLPGNTSGLIDCLLSKSPEQRPESALAVLESLQRAETASLMNTPTETVKHRGPVAPATNSFARTLASPPDDGRTGTPWRLLFGGFAGFLLLLAVVVYRIQTDHGTLVVSIENDDQVAAKLMQSGLVITDAKTGRTWTLAPDTPEPIPTGDYKLSPVNGLQLKVTDDSGTEFKTTEFKIKRGDQATIRVTLEPNAADSKDQVLSQMESPAKATSPAGSPLDKLDYSQIPEKERLDYLPRETVAVLGTHERKTWGSPFFRIHGALSYSPDGKWICACDFGNIYLFDAATLALRKQLPVLVGTSYRPFAFSSNGQKLFIASSATVTDLTSPQLTTERIPDLPNANLISNSPDDRFVIQKYDSLLIGTRNQATSKVSNLTPIPDAPGFPKEASLGYSQEMGLSPDGIWLIVGYGGFGYRIFRKQEDTFTPAADIPSDIGHQNARVVFSFTETHKRVLLYGADRCHLVDLSTDVPQELEAPEHLREVTDICTTPDGQMWAATIYRVGAASLLLLGHWIEGHPVLEVQEPLDGGRVSGQVAFSPDGRTLAVMGGVPVLQITDVSTLLLGKPAHSAVNDEPLNNRDHNTGSIDAITAPAVFTQTSISAQGDKMLTVGMDGTVRLQKLDGGVLQTLDSLTTERPLIGAILTSDASRAVTFSRPDQAPSMRSQVWIWNLEHDTLQEIAKFDASEDRMWASVGLLNEGQRLLWGNQIWDISSSTPSVVTEFKQLPPRPVACTWTENEEFVAFSGTDGLVSLYRMSGPVDQPLATAQLPAVPVSLSLSSDGKKLAASFAGGLCKVWNLVDGKFEESLSMPGQWNFTPHQAPPYHMQSTVFSRDGHRIYFSGWGGVGEWNLDENQVTRYWPLPGGTQLSIATDNRHLFLHNGNCTTWILRLTNP